MQNLPPETKALRQTIYVALIAFVLGFVVTLVALEWVIEHFITPNGRWWDVLHASLDALLISVFGGLCFSLGSIWVLGWFHYWQGIYRCPYCGKRLKGSRVPCDCPQARALRNSQP